ncbi:phage tail tube protein [Rhizobium ruizarguesonis]|uniref:Phage tail tube protein n=1 Tax=Rhizobium ruizarguesonis TaxID=2081791 RepID=A0ACD5EMI5_9HYPH
MIPMRLPGLAVMPARFRPRFPARAFSRPESVETWLDAWENVESVPVKIEIEFPAKTITWTGLMHVSSLNPSTEQGGRVTMSVEMQSDGELVRTVS